MFDLITKIQRVYLKKFVSESTAVLRQDDDINLLYDFIVGDLVLKFEFSRLLDITPYDDRYIMSNEEDVYEITNSRISLILRDHYLNSEVFEERYVLVREDNLRGPAKKVDLIGGMNIVWTVPDTFNTFVCRFGIVGFPQDKSQIKLIDSQAGEVKWSMDVSELARQDRNGKVTDGQVIDYLGIHDGLLWFSLTDYKVIAVDTALGEIVHMVEGLPDQYKLRLDADNNLIIGMIDEKLWEVSTRSLQTKIYELDKEFASKKLKAVNVDCDTEHYYFIDHYQGYLGALDRGTKELKDLFRIEEVNPNDMRTMLSKIYYRRDRILVTDIRGNLWIFSVMGKNRS